MKHTFVIACIAASLSATGQNLTTEIGFISRMQPMAKIGIDYSQGRFTSDLGLMASADNQHPVIELQAGIQGYEPGDRLKLMAGIYYHTGLMPIELEKSTRISCLRFGGSIRFQWFYNIYMGGTWNGETGRITIGYVFKNPRK